MHCKNAPRKSAMHDATRMLSPQTPVCMQVPETFYYCQMFVYDAVLRPLAMTINTS